MTEVDAARPPTAPRPVPLCHRLEDSLLTLLVAALVLLSCAQILLRNFLELTFPWIDPLTRHLVLWSSFLGALVATRQARHIRIDAALRLLPPGWRRRVSALGDAVAGGVCLLLSFIAVRFVLDERAYEGAVFLDLPQWTLQLLFPVVFGLMAVRFLAAAWRQLRD